MDSSVAPIFTKEISMSRALVAFCGVASLSVILGGCSFPNKTDSNDAPAASASKYLIVDLATGARVGKDAVADLATNDDYRTNKMVFKYRGGAYIGVFETTQRQWFRIAGTKPASSVSALNGNVPSVGYVETSPVFGLSFDAVVAGLKAYQGTTGITLALPSASEWKAVADVLPGETSIPWSSITTATVASYALVKDVKMPSSGPAKVGSRNDLNGFYDVHGNVRELTDDGLARGGSWFDPLAQSDTGSVVELLSAAPHLLSGVRLVLR